MKKSRIIAPALGVLILSTAASITGTVAWFTANNSVAVTGMTVKTRVSSNLLISADTTEANFASELPAQSISAILEPASSSDGSAFYYTVSAKGDGSAAAQTSDDYVLYDAEEAANDTENYEDAFSEAYGITSTIANTTISGQDRAYPFVDYTFYLKATSTTNDQKVSLKFAKLLYNGDVTREKAWRVAFFTNPGQSTAALAGSTDTSLLSVISPNGATYFETNKAAHGVEIANRATVTNLGTAVTIESDLDAGATKYYKVVARLWLEGEDTTCTNDTFANLTNSWTLDLEIELGNNTGATSIKTSNVDVALSNSNKTATVTLNNNKTAASYVWKNAADNSIIAGATSEAYTNDGVAKQVYCVITDNEAGTHTSDFISLAAAA